MIIMKMTISIILTIMIIIINLIMITEAGSCVLEMHLLVPGFSLDFKNACPKQQFQNFCPSISFSRIAK